jgi:hypothetical protein
MKTPEQLITHERARQIAVEGWDSDHDDQHRHGELSAAAQCYISNNAAGWPWDKKWWKPGGSEPKDAVRRLAKAGALIRAERERLERREQEVVALMDVAISMAESREFAERNEGCHR